MTTPNEVKSTTTAQSTVANTAPELVVTVSNVAEIFNAAGFAFKKLGELVQHLDPSPSGDGGVPANGASNGLSHWDSSDVEQFQAIITNFNDELSKLSNNLKNKMSKRLHREHENELTNTITTEPEQQQLKLE